MHTKKKDKNIHNAHAYAGIERDLEKEIERFYIVYNMYSVFVLEIMRQRGRRRRMASMKIRRKERVGTMFNGILK